jgi:hypothetical protein
VAKSESFENSAFTGIEELLRRFLEVRHTPTTSRSSGSRPNRN